jgi:hypothetical protein
LALPECKSIESRHHEIEHDQLRRETALQLLQRTEAVCCGLDAVALLGQEFGEGVSNRGLVIDHQKNGSHYRSSL